MTRREDSRSTTINADYDALAKRVALPYLEVGMRLGLSPATLAARARAGSVAGRRAYRKHHRQEVKEAAYVLWWMRRGVHRALVSAALRLATTNSRRAKGVLLDLLED